MSAIETKQETKVAVAYIVIFTIFIIATSAQNDLLDFISVENRSFDSPPWYFILNDLKGSITAVIGLILSLIFTFTFLKHRGKDFLFLVFFVFLWFGKNIGDGINILLNTTNVLNADTATTTWATHSDYLDSPWNSYLFFIYLLGIAIVHFILLKKLNNSPQE